MSCCYTNNAEIRFTGIIPEEAMPKCKEIVGAFTDNIWFEYSASCKQHILVIQEEPGDWLDTLNELVDYLRPYGIKPEVGCYNHYYGDWDGYDVFTGEKFESMDEGDYAVYALTNEELIKMLEERGYTVTKNKG